MPSNKGKTFEAHALEKHEVSSMVAASTRPRDRAILILLWKTGLRSNEACSLDVEHVRFQSDGSVQIKVNKPKNVKRGAPKRVVALSPAHANTLKVWLSKRGNGPGPFFCTSKGSRLVNSQIRRTVALAGKKAGLKRRVHPHALRHTFCTSLYKEGVGIRHIQVALGHKSLNSTEVYLQDIGCHEVVSILSERD